MENNFERSSGEAEGGNQSVLSIYRGRDGAVNGEVSTEQAGVAIKNQLSWSNLPADHFIRPYLKYLNFHWNIFSRLTYNSQLDA